MNTKFKVFLLMLYTFVFSIFKSTSQDLKLHTIEYYNSACTYYFFSDTSSNYNRLISITDMILDDNGELFLVGRFDSYNYSIIRKKDKDFLGWSTFLDSFSGKSAGKIMKGWDGSLCSLGGTATFLRSDYTWSNNSIMNNVPNGEFAYMDKRTNFWIFKKNYDKSDTENLYYMYGDRLKLVLDSIPENGIITEDRNNNMWLGNKSGVFKISSNEPIVIDSLSKKSICSKLSLIDKNTYKIIQTKDTVPIRNIEQLVFTENNQIWGNIDGEVAYYNNQSWLKIGNLRNENRFKFSSGLLIPYKNGVIVVRYDNIYYVTDKIVTAILPDEIAKCHIPFSPSAGLYDEKNNSLWLGGNGLLKIQLGENIDDLQKGILHFPDRDSLLNLSKEQLRVFRNEVFAREGYVFASQDLNSFFKTKEWYKPKDNNGVISLTPQELHLVAYIRSIENEKNNMNNGYLIGNLSGFFRKGEEIERSNTGAVPFVYNTSFNKKTYKSEGRGLYYNFIVGIGVFNFYNSFNVYLIEHQSKYQIINMSNNGIIIDTFLLKSIGDYKIKKIRNFIEIERSYFKNYTKKINNEDITVNLENSLLKLNKSIDYKFLTNKENRYSEYLFYDYYHISDSGLINYIKIDSLKISIDRKYPFVSGRIVMQDELNKFSKDELRLMRNEIFAEHSYIFKSQDLQNYFNKQKWYVPEKRVVPENELNFFEKENLKTILLMESNQNRVNAYSNQ